MTFPQFVVGIPAQILDLVQSGTLERVFHEALVPTLMYREIAEYEPWEANSGTEIFVTRPGLMNPITKPLKAGTDPTPQKSVYEQWIARLARFAGTTDINMQNAAVALPDFVASEINQLGTQAGESIDRVARNTLYRAYLGGHTVLLAAATTGDLTIRVVSCNGFQDVINRGANTRPVAVSSNNMLGIILDPAATNVKRNVVACAPDDADDENGPGTLFLDSPLPGNLAVRIPVLSVARPKILRSGGGFSVDAIATTDTFTIQDAINAATELRKRNVRPFEDGFYHSYIDPDANSQLFLDPFIKQLNTSLPDGDMFKTGFIGHGGGVAFFSCNSNPEDSNTGALTPTSSNGNAMYAEEIGGEVVNVDNVRVGRVIVFGKGAMYEKGLDEGAYVPDSGISGKIQGIQAVSNGITIPTDRINLILRAPINRTQDQMAATWSSTTSFPVPSDIASGGPERFKRAVVIEHALN